jgi:transposase-like protein
MSTIRCPRCRSEAYYSYGHTKNGKQRYICLVCNRQFVNAESDKAVRLRPGCPFCGKRMHVYMRNLKFIRFRCSTYPRCRGYAKISQEN